MTILPSQSTNPALTTAKLAAQPQQTAASDNPADTAASGAKVSVSASYSSTVTIGSAAQRSHTFVSNGVAKYEAIGDAVKPKNPTADNILSFIANRVAMDLAEGASSEEIESRLAAALEGFLEGFGQAREQLEGTGLLSPDIESLIQGTYDNVLAGIDDLAAQYAVTSPVSRNTSDESLAPESTGQAAQGVEGQASQIRPNFSAGTSVQNVFTEFAEQALDAKQNLEELLKGTEVNYELLASREFSFRLKTQDGDEVTISASAVQGERGGSNGGGQVNASAFSSSQFSLSVDGELDEGELGAISDLLAQIGELSTAFFSGDIEQAFELALNVGFDSQEIAKFSLTLEQQVSAKVQAAYTNYGATNTENDLEPQSNGMQDLLSFANGNNSLSRLASFVAMLEDITFKAEDLGLSRSVIPEFAGYLADSVFTDKADKQSLQPFLEKLLS